MQTKMNMTYILFISTENKVGGCAIVEKISQAHRVIPSSVPSQIGSPKKILHSESESVQALCGICRLWTAPMYRRQKVATRILDCLRCNFIYGYLLNVDDIAFLDPTIDGRQFVEKYTETPNYLEIVGAQRKGVKFSYTMYCYYLRVLF
ncbi:N-acetyltransferase ESCO2-like [Centruroides sculpturatus]|uniref:N-acetyltransferase ESCO2-like n=1 Tax=Centruroides sculpturatus TaxID=218467 RepID=UPI000C6DC8AC|nr:N-acetyltransferase ESCO2-like [Centruroides sculpturatus]